MGKNVDARNVLDFFISCYIVYQDHKKGNNMTLKMKQISKIQYVPVYKKHPSQEAIDLAFHIIDWLYYSPREHYNDIPFFKDDFRNAIEGFVEGKIDEKIHRDMLARDPRSTK